MSSKLLEVKNLAASFKTERGLMKAIDGISFYAQENEILGIVGESGCGKSVTCQSVLRLYDEKHLVKLEGEILFDGENLLKYSEKEMEHIRGGAISMVFQDALSALNPVMKIGDQIVEGILLHHKELSKAEAKERALNILEQVGIPAFRERFEQYPHELSGGMRQRIMIAIALVCGVLGYGKEDTVCFGAADSHRRRAYDGAGCDNSGADHESDRPSERGNGNERHPDYPRSGGCGRDLRPGRRYVSGTDCGGGGCERTVSASGSSVYQRNDDVDSFHVGGKAGAAVCDSGYGSSVKSDTVWMQVCPQVRICHAAMPGSDAGTGRTGERP